MTEVKHKEVKSKVYKAVKKDGKCILVKKQRPKPKVSVVKPPVKTPTPVPTAVVGSLTQVPTAESQALAVKRELDIRQRALTEASKKTQKKEQAIDNIIRQLLHKGVPPKIEPTKTDIAVQAVEPTKESIETDDGDLEERIARNKIKKEYKDATARQMVRAIRQMERAIKKLGNDYDNTSNFSIKKTISKEGDKLVYQLDELQNIHMKKLSTEEAIKSFSTRRKPSDILSVFSIEEGPDTDEDISIEEGPESGINIPPPTQQERINEEDIGGEGAGKIEGGLMNTEIDDMMKSTKSFKGSIPADMIHTLPSNKVMNFIINKDKSGQPGSHWCCVYIDTIYDKEICYYDPLGNPPSKEVENDLKELVKRINPRHKLKYKVNTMRNQKNNTDTCGFMCMRFLKDMIRGDSFKKATGYCNKHNKDNSNHFEDKARRLAGKFFYI
jgi:hypothetical protein